MMCNTSRVVTCCHGLEVFKKDSCLEGQVFSTEKGSGNGDNGNVSTRQIGRKRNGSAAAGIFSSTMPACVYRL